jgi:hypothetical protein
MTTFFHVVISILVVLLLLVISRDIYHTKPETQIDAKRMGILIGYILLLLFSSLLIIKFV